ncbi:SRPBCC family protein [Aureimonas ureilytica]|uniref:SRPBCC family protein n=1 Tax=Aureimonas ureilytica TaxID=401562 RepID=UPI00037B6BBA|nr:hypothetical protein [Aureimonas ureilytica]
MSDGRDGAAPRGETQEDEPHEGGGALDLTYDLDAPPAKVWRALSIPAFRERWLPDVADPEPDAGSVVPGEALRYRLRESEPPFETSAVTFRISPNETGGTRLRILHERGKAAPPLMAANTNQAARARVA